MSSNIFKKVVGSEPNVSIAGESDLVHLIWKRLKHRYAYEIGENGATNLLPTNPSLLERAYVVIPDLSVPTAYIVCNQQVHEFALNGPFLRTIRLGLVPYTKGKDGYRILAALSVRKTQYNGNLVEMTFDRDRIDAIARRVDEY